MENNSAKSAIIKSIVLVVLGAIIILGAYLLVTRSKKPKGSEDYDLTVVDGITTTDLNKNYPPDGMKVVELYAKIMQVLYKETYTEDQEDDMIKVLKGIMDDELIAGNPNFANGIKNDVKTKREEDYSIPLFVVTTKKPVTKELDGKKTQLIECKFLLRHGTISENIIYQFILRKDDEGKWKIYGWEPKVEQDGN